MNESVICLKKYVFSFMKIILYRIYFKSFEVMGPLTVNNEQQNVLLSGFTTNLYLYDFAGSKIVQLFLFVDVERDG